jgi:hypothetical protein
LEMPSPKFLGTLHSYAHVISLITMFKIWELGALDYLVKLPALSFLSLCGGKEIPFVFCV